MKGFIETFADQAKRLFSSKQNPSNLIYSTTDSLHKYKLMVLALSMGLLFGYSQFREHFECQVTGNIDKKQLTSFCWTNGTTTVDYVDQQNDSSNEEGRLAPHVGIHFRLNDGKYEVINHNYMNSLWLLLLLMALCSIIARRYRSSIFSRDSLVALLKLPGYDKLPVVKKVHNCQPYALLSDFPARTDKELMSSMEKLDALIDVEKGCAESLEDDKEDNLSLDYYVNHLLFILLANSTTYYKISGLKLKSRLIKYQFISFFMTILQFVLPRLFIGSKYNYYGWQMSQAWWDYVRSQLLGNSKHEPNRLGYEISAQIWPTSTQCQYEQFGLHGIERITVQCNVSMNEICAKLFVVIWWVVALNCIVELVSLLILITSSLSYKITSSIFSFNYWPRERAAADYIANFRYQHASQTNKLTHVSSDIRSSTGTMDTPTYRKGREASADRRPRYHESRFKSWFRRYSYDEHKFSEFPTPRNPDGFKETRNDVNMLFLLHLLFLRLKCSSKKTQLVIRAVDRALQIYLDKRNKSPESGPLMNHNAVSPAIQLQSVDCLSKSGSALQVSQA